MKVLYVSKFISINKFLCIINIDLHCQQSFVDCLLIIAPIFLLALDIFSYLMIYTAAIFPIATTHSQQQQEKTHQFFFSIFPSSQQTEIRGFFPPTTCNMQPRVSHKTCCCWWQTDRQTHFICCRRHRFMLFLALFGPKREIFNKSKVILTFYD